MRPGPSSDCLLHNLEYLNDYLDLQLGFRVYSILLLHIQWRCSMTPASSWTSASKSCMTATIALLRSLFAHLHVVVQTYTNNHSGFLHMWLAPGWKSGDGQTGVHLYSGDVMAIHVCFQLHQIGRSPSIHQALIQHVMHPL